MSSQVIRQKLVVVRALTREIANTGIMQPRFKDAVKDYFKHLDDVLADIVDELDRITTLEPGAAGSVLIPRASKETS